MAGFTTGAVTPVAGANAFAAVGTTGATASITGANAAAFATGIAVPVAGATALVMVGSAGIPVAVAPVSALAMVGTSGRIGDRSAVVTASPRKRPARMCSIDVGKLSNSNCT